MWKWIKALWATLLEFLVQYKKIQDEQDAESKERREEIEKEVVNEIKKQHQEVVNSTDPNAVVDSQLKDLDLVK